MRVAFGAILLLVSLQASAQVAGLMDLYRAAQRNDPVFAAARATHAAGLESRAIGLSGLLPTLRGSASASAVAQDWTSGGARRRDDYLARTGAISLTQPLFDLEKFTDLDIGGMQAAQADSVFKDDESMKGFLNFMANCTPQSTRNLLILYEQNTEITHPRTFDKWKEA